MLQPWVEVDLDELRGNLRRARQTLPAGTALMFVVKANAYGHGLVPVARAAAADGVEWFAVAYAREALALRQALPGANLLVLGVAGPEDVPALIDQGIVATVVDAEHARALGAAAERAGRRLAVHVKLDTGLGRLGIPWERAEQELPRVAGERGLELRGLFSHFAAVEPDDPAGAGRQVERFRAAERLLGARGGARLFRHLSSSRGFLLRPDWDFDAVRPGIALYGYGAQDAAFRFQTQPILQWKTSVLQVKTVPAGTPVGYYGSHVTAAATELATLAVGYADGFPRLLSNRGHVLLHGRRCPVVGRVSMNWITADAGPDSGVRPGDEVVLIGRQGAAAIWADEIAARCGTIPYEILVNLRAQTPHRYTGGGA